MNAERLATKLLQLPPAPGAPARDEYDLLVPLIEVSALVVGPVGTVRERVGTHVREHEQLQVAVCRVPRVAPWRHAARLGIRSRRIFEVDAAGTVVGGLVPLFLAREERGGDTGDFRVIVLALMPVGVIVYAPVSVSAPPRPCCCSRSWARLQEQARMQRTQDSLATVAIERQGQEAEQALKTQPEKPADKLVAAPVLAEGDTVATDSLLMAARDQRFGIFHPSATGTNKEVVIENDHLQVALSSHGAKPSVIRLKEYLTHVKTPLYLADPDSGNYEFKFIIGNQDISTNDLYFTAEKQGKDGVRFTAATTDPAKFLRITYTLDTTSYFMDVRAEVVGMDDEVDARNTVFNWELVGFANEKYRTGELQKCGVYYKYFSDSRQYLSESKEDEKKLEGRTNWIAFKQDFFTVALISAEGFAGNGSETRHYTAGRHDPHQEVQRQALLREGPGCRSERCR